ncbi:MAG TPA: ABC transporter substrate-binding protein [Candidatus Lustribacter sp.]|jgi:NitT/TauT family transport system substrate-binding protein|nr:ABC transporter substrate-binding protein [Candidatus Lustribacter sp.]
MKRAAFASLLAGAAAAPRLAAAQGAPTVIRLGTAPVESYALAFYGVDRGFFKAANLDVQIQSFSGGGGVMTAAAGNALDIGCANVGAQANAHMRNLPFSMIAGGGNYSSNSPTTVLAVAKNSPLKTAKDLNGKTIGCSTLKDLQQVSVMKWVDSNGGDSSTLKFLEIPVPEMAPALVAGRIDGACELEPSLTFAKNDIRTFGKCYDAISKTLTITTHFANTDWLAKNPAAAKAFVAAMRATAQWANKNQAAAATILERVSQIPAETVGVMNRVVFAEGLDASTIQPVIDATAQYKFIPKTFNVTEMFWKP